MMKSLPENNQRQFLPQLAAAQVRMEDLEGALKTIDLLSPTWKRVGQESVAIAQARTGDVAGALRTLKAMERAAPGGGRARAPNQLGGRVLQAVARAQAKAGDKAGVEATLKALRPIVDDLYLLEAKLAGRPGMSGFSQAADLEGTIALTQYQIGDVAGARRTALAIKAGREKARALLDIGEAAAAAGKKAEAREFLLESARAAETAGRAASTLWQIADQQAKVGDVQEALRTFERMGDGPGRDVALASIVTAQATAGDVKGALQTLARVQAKSGKERALEGLVEALVRAGDERVALAVVEGQKSQGLKARALLGLAKGRAKETAGKKRQPGRGEEKS